MHFSIFSRQSALICCFLILFIGGYAQQDLLQSGPMVGYSTMKEVMLWVQTKETANVKINYWLQGDKATLKSTDEVNTKKENAFTAHLIADQVEPGNIYEYQLVINDKVVKINHPLEFKSQKLWQWREEPPTFSFALGSCSFLVEEKYDRPGKPYGGQYGIFEQIDALHPDFMIWLGDNVYFREPDWNSLTGMQHRYTRSRAQKHLQPLLGRTHHYATWDDHDYGPNDADKSFWNKALALKTFKDFWANPNYVLDKSGGGVTGTFFWNDIQFFLLDGRWFKTANRNNVSKKELLGQQQIEWLINALTYTKASFKFIVLGVPALTDVAKYENYANYADERAQLLDAIKKANVPGVIFLTGDSHHSELTKLEQKDFYPLYDLTVSPLTASVYSVKNSENSHLVAETIVNERNFAHINVSGSIADRQLSISIYNSAGKQLWNKTILKKELKYDAHPAKD